jgi:hypothetical protein
LDSLIYLPIKNYQKNDSIAATNKKQDSADNANSQPVAEDSAAIATAPAIENRDRCRTAS